MGSEPVDQVQQQVARVVEQGLERIETPAAAHAVVARVERLSAGQTEAERGQTAAQQLRTEAPPDQTHAAAAARVEQAAAQPSAEQAMAEVLSTAAAEAVAPVPAAAPVLEGARAKLVPEAPVTPAARRGRRLLKEAALRRMGPLSRLDAQLYLAINEGPHPGWLDSCAWALAIITIGGWIWVVGTLLAYLLRIPRSWTAVMRLLPCVVGATWVVEYPVKTFFRRRRPFVQIVQALVIGKKPGSWSFPSGHTASSFASAWTLATVWPERAPLFFGLAGSVGLSRIYVGAHYPGDVLSGALFGTLLSEVIRRLAGRVFPLH